MPDYDTYTELARIRAATNASLAFQQIQSHQLSNLRRTMSAIDDEIAAVRQTQNEALAVQQTLLQREVIQGQIEEFIFQTEKLVTQFSESDCELPASTRFFLLRGVLDYVKQNGVSTPVIRGRDNKTAFETVMQSVQSLTKKLQIEPEVREAIEWANAEQKRAQAARKKQQDEQTKAHHARQKQIQQLEVRYSTLNARINAPPEFGLEDFKDWYGRAVTPLVKKYSGPIPDTVAHVAVWTFGGLTTLPILYLVLKYIRRNEGNAPLRAELRQIEDELNTILADQSVEGPVTGIVLHSEQEGA
ncbi:MAG: hypothetical protein R3C18_00010 [Planctomycetaceae bacterium]